MNTILLQPTDVLFFRDGRPMSGASAGHGAAWPLPTVVNHAFHAALHRAGDVFAGVHAHRRGRAGVYQSTRDRRFGSLLTAGPFPVCTENANPRWFFPRPADADDVGSVVLKPHRQDAPSSLPSPCKYPVVSIKPPSKSKPSPWWNEDAWEVYLGSTRRSQSLPQPLRKQDADFADVEHTYGIGIDPDTGTVRDGQFYSANYLRLRDGWKLGVLATAPDKDFHHKDHGNDLLRALLNGHGTVIITGGQQRVCTATLSMPSAGRLPLPLGLKDGFTQVNGKWLVKWVLLSPAIWPEISSGVSKDGTVIQAHPGGWIPNWVFLDWDAETREPRTLNHAGEVMLKLRHGKLRRDYSGPVARRVAESESTINARLVSAIVSKPVPVSGWALPNDTDRTEGGAKATHLAVPAGAVYYFEADSAEDAARLAAALNWHGSDAQPQTIKNRRSTLMGEKGFGLGVCGTWTFLGTSPDVG